MTKFWGVCLGKISRKVRVGNSEGICVSCDRISAITLCDPFMCCEYNAESCRISVDANHLATLLCAGWQFLKLVLYSHPTALELSLNARTLCVVLDFDIVRYIVMAAAINSSKLINSLFCSSLGNLYRHANPLVLYPPNPCLQASENITMVGFVKVILLILIPFLHNL